MRLALLAGIAACGGSGPLPHPGADAHMPDSNKTCDVLAQTGCAAGKKCTWFVDLASPNVTGHIGCAPDGTRDVGEACTRNPPGELGYDDCAAGAYCFGPAAGGDGVCKAICSRFGGAPSCASSLGCTTYADVFGSGFAVAAGMCERTCDPLVDNDFLGSGARGSACGSGSGCFGAPNSSAATIWTCRAELDPSRVHRSVCDLVVHAGDLEACVDAPSDNGCAQGYEPIIREREGSSETACVALCRPGTCYAGNCGDNSTTATSNLAGIAPRQCITADVRYEALTEATLGLNGVNGEQCMFSWVLEVDAQHHLVRSPTSDTVGFCIDHSRYQWPKCDQLDAGSAAAYGCVDSVTAGAMFVGKTLDVRRPYH